MYDVGVIEFIKNYFNKWGKYTIKSLRGGGGAMGIFL